MMRVLLLPLCLWSLSFSVDEAKNRPVSKVIQLLKDMQVQLEKEQKLDEETYEQLACWCKLNNREKAQSIKEAEQLITQLTSYIEEHSANVGRLSTEIENSEGEIAKNEEALNTATALRGKQHDEFVAEEKDLVQSITALKSAVIVLSKHRKKPEETLLSIKALIKHQMLNHDGLLDQVITPHEKRVLRAFMQQTHEVPDFQPQSGEIFGILRNMKDTFQANLAASQKEEQENQKAFEGLKKAKMDEINAGKNQLAQKTEQLANSQEKAAQAKEDIEDTRASLGTDYEFLMEVKAKCATTDAEWEERQKARQEEIMAVSQALSVLSNDDAHDLFSKSFNQFLQLTAPTKRHEAANVLLAVHSPRLTAMATSVKLDAFKKVFEAIDQMVTQLQKEKEDEIKHRDWCINELHTNEKDTQRVARDKERTEVLIADLSTTIKTMGAEVDALSAEITEMQIQFKRAGEDREKENSDFQATVADQREVQKLLQQALNVLKSFYARGHGFLQKAPDEPKSLKGAPAPEGFGEYRKSEASGGVLVMIQQIIGDAKAMEADATRAEADAQAAYESFVKQTNLSVAAKSKSIDNKKEEKAKSQVDKTDGKVNLEAHTVQLEQLSNAAGDVHKSCDFIVKNFEVRQTARDEEVSALRQAKAILSGAKFSNAFLQPHVF
eukprot:GEMP01029148.1.p1 GENE.GEMP01029148.1~~GEMP01029148.1.p1  ORF type:complete len:667 (+),score=210.48 GEMP01029148.1:225-2225(+)